MLSIHAYMYIAIRLIPEKDGQQMSGVEVRSCCLVPEDLDLNPLLILAAFHIEEALKVPKHQFLCP